LKTVVAARTESRLAIEILIENRSYNEEYRLHFEIMAWVGSWCREAFILQFLNSLP